jgi:hypothetical protein
MKWLAVLTLFVCVLVAVPFAAALQVPSTGAVFAVPEENGNVILLSGTTYSDNGATYLPGNYSDGQIYAWYFPMFSMGNGTTNLRITAKNCNITITSYKSQLIPIGTDLYNVTKCLNLTTTELGTKQIDYGMVNNQTTTVYLNGNLKQLGDGWIYTDFGVKVTDAATNIAIYTQYTDFLPPRGYPGGQPNTLTYAGIIIGLIIAILIIFGMTEFKGYRHKKAETKQT